MEAALRAVGPLFRFPIECEHGSSSSRRCCAVRGRGTGRMQRFGQRFGLGGRMARIGCAHPHRFEGTRLPHARTGARYVLVNAHSAARMCAFSGRRVRASQRQRQPECRTAAMGSRARRKLPQCDHGLASDLHDVHCAARNGRVSADGACDKSADADAVCNRHTDANTDAHSPSDSTTGHHDGARVRSAFRDTLTSILERPAVVRFE